MERFLPDLVGEEQPTAFGLRARGPDLPGVQPCPAGSKAGKRSKRPEPLPPDFCPGPPTGLHLLPFHSEPRGYVCASVHSALDVPCPGVTHAFPPGMLPGSHVTRGVRRGGRLVGCTPSRCLLLQFEVEWRRLKAILFSPF